MTDFNRFTYDAETGHFKRNFPEPEVELRDEHGILYCCSAGIVAWPDACPWHDTVEESLLPVPAPAPTVQENLEAARAGTLGIPERGSAESKLIFIEVSMVLLGAGAFVTGAIGFLVGWDNITTGLLVLTGIALLYISGNIRPGLTDEDYDWAEADADDAFDTLPITGSTRDWRIR